VEAAGGGRKGGGGGADAESTGERGSVKLADKAIAMMGDAQLEKKNLEHLDENQRENISGKAAKLVGSEVVLKKKLRDRFGSEIHREAKEMQAAKEKYEALMSQNGATAYVQGAAGTAYLAIKEKVKKAGK
jgi:hypothetical protein